MALTEKNPQMRRTERGTFGGSVLRNAAGCTTPEPPGMTGPGPPVTEDTSGSGFVSRCKQGGTVEQFKCFTPEIQG